MGDEIKSRAVQEDDLLVEFERKVLPDHYKEYYKIKRQNFFASIQQFPLLWNCFMLLDKIWLRELEDFTSVTSETQMFPLVLYMNAHNKMRIALELGFSACTTEAFSIMRDAIESAAHANKMLLDPDLMKVWLQKEGGKPQRRAYKEAFEHEKKKRLFHGLFELHQLWATFSEMGAHTTMPSLISRFVIVKSATHVEWKLTYTGVPKEKEFAGALFMLLLAAFEMEQLLFKNFSDRLHLDTELMKMRVQFEREKEKCRKEMITRYKIAPPTARPSYLPDV